MRSLAFTLLTALGFRLLGAQSTEAPPDPVRTMAAVPAQRQCLDCHTCADPSKEAPCLVPCPRSTLAAGPEVVLIDHLSNQYVPVVFAHKLHAQMTEMSGGCALCHHFNPTHRILPCRECHSPLGSADLTKPGLRGAYHRQCLNCHREWSHQTDCAVCHAKRTANYVAIKLPDPSDIMGTLHPNAHEPTNLVYQTTYELGALVTFRHQDHVKRFGFRCVDCHRAQNCSRCHKPETSVVRTKTFTQHHSPCAQCHETAEEKTDACAHCHSDREIPQFQHDKTGLVLDESHKDAACTDCHVGSRFRQPPTCSGCHEEEEQISFPAKLPGTRLKAP
ncbi:MAG: hypothetical protein FJ387_13825 [Verrucomicrobia bacterium]|nr:hypothetical protein [Verrucomicrobiota bacterium]